MGEDQTKRPLKVLRGIRRTLVKITVPVMTPESEESTTADGNSHTHNNNLYSAYHVTKGFSLTFQVILKVT